MFLVNPNANNEIVFMIDICILKIRFSLKLLKYWIVLQYFILQCIQQNRKKLMKRSVKFDTNGNVEKE